MRPGLERGLADGAAATPPEKSVSLWLGGGKGKSTDGGCPHLGTSRGQHTEAAAGTTPTAMPILLTVTTIVPGPSSLLPSQSPRKVTAAEGFTVWDLGTDCWG